MIRSFEEARARIEERAELIRDQLLAHGHLDVEHLLMLLARFSLLLEVERTHGDVKANCAVINAELCAVNAESATATRRARIRHANDPKQEEKQQVKVRWEDWQRDRSKYKDKTDFARMMLTETKHLKNMRKITDWCRAWERTSKK